MTPEISREVAIKIFHFSFFFDYKNKTVIEFFLTFSYIDNTDRHSIEFRFGPDVGIHTNFFVSTFCVKCRD